MSNFTFSKGSIALIVTAVTIVAAVAISGEIPPKADFKTIEKQAFLGTLAWLFTVALFLERAVEVVIMVLRDQEAEEKQAVVKTDEAALAALTAQPTPAAAEAISNSATTLKASLAALATYRAETKKIALNLSFILGVIVSLAAVRSLGLILSNPPSHWLFQTVDVLLAGAILAGGSEGIHKMATVFTNFMESLAAKTKP